MQKPTRILISSLVIVTALFSAIVSGKPARVVQAEHTDENTQEDAYGNVVFESDVAFNYLQEPSGEFSRVTLDGDQNVIGKEKLSADPFGGSLDNVDLQMDGVLSSTSIPEESFLVNEWTYHLYGSGLGASGLNISDINDDGIVEIVAGDTSTGGFGANNRWFVLLSITPTNYVQMYVSETYTQSVTQVLTADVDGNAIDEIYVALADKSLLIYSGADFSLIESFSSALVPTSMIIADADGDGTSEIILSDGTGIAAYNARTFQLIWQVSDYGGYLAVGDVDGDGNSEIVSSKGYVLDGTTRDVEWYYSASSGFGTRVAIGDIDGDGILEIVGTETWYKITVYKANLKSPMWDISTQLNIAALTLTDMNGDNRPEIVYGDAQWGSLHAVDGQTHQVFWEIQNPKHGITRIAVGDTNHDGQQEVLWGAGFTSTGADYLYVAGVLSKTIEWKNIDMDGPLYAVDIGDVDDDGQIEIVMASNSSLSGYGDGIISIFDGDTHALEWQSQDLPGIDTWSGIGSLRIGDVDQDGRTEFVLATADTYDGLIQIYDGATHTLERQSEEFFGASMTALEIGDVDGDSQMEIVVGQSREHTGATGVYLVVFDGATAAVEWKSIGLDTYWGGVCDIQLADVDQDHQEEIIASITGGSVYVFDGVTHVMETLIPTTAYSLAVADLNHNGRQSILVGLSDGTVDVFDGTSYVLEKTISLTTNPISCLKNADLDGDKVSEWLVCSSGYLMVYANDANHLLWQSNYIGRALGGLNQIPNGQIDHDTNQEIVVGSTDALFQFESVEANPLTFSKMSVSDRYAFPGDMLIYTIEINNIREEAYPDALSVNPLPAEVSYVPDSLSVSGGNAVYENGIISWMGDLNAKGKIILTYQVLVNDVQMPAIVHNTAQLSAGTYHLVVDAETALGYFTYLPLCSNGCGDFFDTFENTNSGWPLVDDSFLLAEYVNSEYRLQARNPQYIYLINAPTCMRQNYSVEVDAHWENVSGDGYGLLFGLDQSYTQFYLFVVSEDYQEYALYYYGANGYESIVSWQYSSLIHYSSSNHLKVIRSGNQITLGINGSILGTWTDTRISGLTGVGLFNLPYSTTSNADVRYDNFSVKLLSSEAISITGRMQSQAGSGLFSPGLSWGKQENISDLLHSNEPNNH
jgi:uncharacterized repeat protein (TIGR01451 family)